MIAQLSSRHSRKIACTGLVLFYLSTVLPGRLQGAEKSFLVTRGAPDADFNIISPVSNGAPQARFDKSHLTPPVQVPKKLKEARPDIGGPSQPEMSSFKSVGTDNMVNLFTGDFSYNIPLMDVGGYPLNIYYTGGITMEQEPSWVGLGWNLNPGNINRNVRGVPDDFNGKDTLVQVQKMKPNKTWGFGVGGDYEFFGYKPFTASIGGELGVAFNNYLGPSLDLSLRGSAGYQIAKNSDGEKSPFSVGANVGIDINSRSGTSFSGGVSMTANAASTDRNVSFGVGLSTGYNSRTGIKALQISEQTSFNRNHVNDGDKPAPMSGVNGSLFSTSISFVKPSYIPTLRMPLTNTAWSGHFEVGIGAYGQFGDVEGELYGQKSEVDDQDTLQKKPMVGYLYYQQAVNHPDYVMDFTRFNDREVTPNTPVISVPQYSYDVFTIQGEGTGGSIRPYRNDLGYVRDNITTSKDKNVSAGGDLGLPGHYGGNFNIIKTPSSIGDWNMGNKLRNAIQFQGASGTFENVYFRNPGENCVIDSNRLKQVGGVDLVRFVLGGTNNSPTIEPTLQGYNTLLQPNGTQVNLTSMPVNTLRNKRTQVTSFLTAEEAAMAGLDTMIKSYDNVTFLDNTTDTLIYTSMSRVSNYRKPHHISQINVTESNGKRYIYGIPVYNVTQKDFTFSINTQAQSDPIPDTVRVPSNADLTVSSSLLQDNAKIDGYLQTTTTPAYAHSFLLSGILSADYVDVTGNGITEDDLGDAVKFNYTRIKCVTDSVHRWRSPLSDDNVANFNSGNRSELKDDKAIVSYGERESWYLSSVESKTMIALFYTSLRGSDGRGARDINGGRKNDSMLRQLDSVALFNKADLKKNGLSNSRAIKTVHFKYSNLLCAGTLDNPSHTGKLTLDSLWFTYNGTTRAFKNKYGFTYTSNQNYLFAASDRWGNYKPASLNPAGLRNGDYPYAIQDTTQKSTIDQYASAWMLNRIRIPSGAQIDVSYETDDYAYVQDRRAADMMQVVGFSPDTIISHTTNNLYNEPSSAPENYYVFVQVPVACANKTEVYNRYLQGLQQLAFKIWVVMPKGPEYITCYATIADYGVMSSSQTTLWIKMNPLAGKSPLSVTTLEYLRQQLPGQAFPGYDVTDETGFKQISEMLGGMLFSLKNAFTDPMKTFRKLGSAMHTDLTKCFVRLNDPRGIKYGGGYRVKSVVLADRWDSMTHQRVASYGKTYDYTTTESFNGGVRKISSGVASYEPSIGGEENPFQNIIQVADYLPAGPTSFGAVEMPAMDAFFPSPVVGYSKVTVRAMEFDTSGTKKTRSGIGKQVTEFYTAKDFPVYYSYTPFESAAVKEFHQANTTAFFNKYAYDYKALSQGFLVATNDMHGKIKSQSSYAENDTTTRISYTENFYKNTGLNSANDKFSFVGKENSGTMYAGNMGVDVDLMTDAREFSVKSSSLEVQAQADILFLLGPIPVITVYPVSGTSANIYRAVTTTKVVTYHGVLDSVVVIDKGSQVSTKNLAYDAETGEPLVTRTNNEFNQAVYNTSYPARWAYGGMGLAYKNIDATFSGINFSDGKITNGGFDLSVFESGDELLMKQYTRDGGCNGQVNADHTYVVWAFDKNKNTTSLITTPDFIFIDKAGKPYTMDNVTFRIIRSGHRNLLDAKTSAVVSMSNPLSTGQLKFDSTTKVINASSTEFKERWLADNDVFYHYHDVIDSASCTTTPIMDSTGYYETSINPYRKGLVGNFRPYRSLVFYDKRKEYDTLNTTNISTDGVLNSFKLYWDFNGSSNLVPNVSSTQWVWNNKTNKFNGKGLELETIDALGTYTSAEYGYNKTIPVAITNNAAYTEMFGEGFEDYGYGESINNTPFNFFNKHVNFYGLANSSIVTTDNLDFKAHSGKYVLQVNGSSTSSLSFPVIPQLDSTSTATLVYQKDSSGSLSTLGGSYSFTSIVPKSTSSTGSATFTTGSPGLAVNILPFDTFPSPNYRIHYYSQSGSFYINITTAKTYNFSMNITTAYNNSGVTVYNHSNDFQVTISGVTSTYGGSSHILGQSGFTSTNDFYSAFLCPGIYLVSYETSELYAASNNGSTGSSNAYNWACTNSTSSDYKNLTKNTTCIFTRPIPAVSTMQNPLFSIPVNKKMSISAWVHETCGNVATGISCKDSTYTHDQIQLKFGGETADDDTLYPTGPIIDGWQKYEGTFTAPFGSVGMTFNLVNSSANSAYFDDIRIHPFNANMKTYAYDPINLRLVTELDPNNYATYYEYDEEGTLVRTKVETRDGIKTVNETRSFLQKRVR